MRELLDIEGQMADLEREREEIKASLEAEAEPNGSAANGSSANGSAASRPAPVDPDAT